jgi:hypothetical protein
MARASAPKIDLLSNSVLVELIHQSGDYIGVMKYQGHAYRD